MINCIIVDDESPVIRRMTTLLNGVIKTTPFQMNIVGTAQNLTDAQHLFTRLLEEQALIHFIFLDIRFEGEEGSGIEFAENFIRKSGIQTQLVFITAFGKDHGLDIIQKFGRILDVNILEKPIQEKELQRVFDEYIQAIQTKIIIFENRTIRIDEVLYFESDTRNSICHLLDGETMKISKNLTTISNELTERKINGFSRFEGKFYLLNKTFIVAAQINYEKKIPRPEIHIQVNPFSKKIILHDISDKVFKNIQKYLIDNNSDV
jgi:DNA-binding LytR/AlgR family response regulator